MGRRRSGRRRAAEDAAGSGNPSASSPPPPPPPRRNPTEDTPALRRALMGLIRGYYLDAISRLPTADLRTSLARGLVGGGHCYGPLHPVDNIIANAIWYNAAFPLRPEDRTEVAVICTQGTDRAARRSLDGLIACLLHILPTLSAADALWLLVRSRADLRVAVASAGSASVPVRAARPSILRAAEPEAVRAAFQVAAEAARHRHPNPAAFALFASSVLLPDDVVEPAAVSRLLASKRGLSSLDIGRLSSALLHHPLPSVLSSRLPPPDPSPKASEFISSKKKGVMKWCNFVLALVDAALRKFATETGLHCELHTIYGDSQLEDESFSHHFHVNFMGQPKEDHSSSSGAGPGRALFFFAEAPRPRHRGFREDDISVCCLVEHSPDIDNCHACLMTNHKINHPSADPVDHTHDVHFGGQCFEIGAIDHDWNFRPTMTVDYLFFDSDRDNGLVEHLHTYFARIAAYCSRVKGNELEEPKPESCCRVLV